MTRMRFSAMGLAFITLVVAGCGHSSSPSIFPQDSKDILDAPDKFELVTFSPKRGDQRLATAIGGFEIVGRVEIKDVATRQKIVKAVHDSVKATAKTEAPDFSALYGIHAVKGDHKAD